jgi:lysophospholipase L1-like esterase
MARELQGCLIGVSGLVTVEYRGWGLVARVSVIGSRLSESSLFVIGSQRILGGVLLAVVLCAGAGCGDDPPTTPTCASCPAPDPVGPLTITCGESVSLTTASHTVTSSMATYLDPSVSGGTQPVSLVCTPESGSVFAKGSTPVTCLATDAIGRQATCSFEVTLEVPAPPIPKLLGTKFLAFGDSLTKGNNGCNTLDCDVLSNPVPQTIDVDYEYPTILKQLLSARYSQQSITVIERGGGGETAETGSYLFPGELAAHRPDAVLILEGVNDFHPLNGPRRPSWVAGSLRTMVQAAKSAGVKVFLSTLPPQIEEGHRAWGYASLAEVNALIRDVAAQEQVVLVDAYAALSTDVTRYISSKETYVDCCTSDTGWADGLHLTRAGRTKLAETFFEAIKANFEEKSSTSALRRLRR